MAKRKEMDNKKRNVGDGSDCGCVNPNVCDCNRSGVDLILHQRLQDLHKQVEAQIPDSFSASS